MDEIIESPKEARSRNYFEIKSKLFGDRLADLLILWFEEGVLGRSEELTVEALRKIELMAKEEYPNQYGSMSL
jgi:hypothetical protein